MHITNYSLNKNSDNFKAGEGDSIDEDQTKRLLTKVIEKLSKENGIDPVHMKRQIIDTITKTVIAMVPYLKNFGKRIINPDIE